jgi:hypothetical protein
LTDATTQQAPAVSAAAGFAAGAFATGGATAGFGAVAGAAAGAVGPLVIEQHTALPLSETCLEVKFAYTLWPTRSDER